MSFALPFAFPTLANRTYLPAAEAFETDGARGLLVGMAISLLVGLILVVAGRKRRGRLYAKEAMAIVGLSWVLATILGALPFYFGGVCKAEGQPVTLIEAMFESQSGFQHHREQRS